MPTMLNEVVELRAHEPNQARQQRHERYARPVQMGAASEQALNDKRDRDANTDSAGHAPRRAPGARIRTTGAYAVVPGAAALGRFTFRVDADPVVVTAECVLRTALAVTCQSPGAISRIRVVIAMRPLPGTTRSTDSTALKLSRGPGFRFTPMRRPANRTVTV